jgi:hypothetical protein
MSLAVCLDIYPFDISSRNLLGYTRDVQPEHAAGANLHPPAGVAYTQVTHSPVLR